MRLFFLISNEKKQKFLFVTKSYSNPAGIWILDEVIWMENAPVAKKKLEKFITNADHPLIKELN